MKIGQLTTLISSSAIILGAGARRRNNKSQLGPSQERSLGFTRAWSVPRDRRDVGSAARVARERSCKTPTIDLDVSGVTRGSSRSYKCAADGKEEKKNNDDDDRDKQPAWDPIHGADVGIKTARCRNTSAQPLRTSRVNSH